MVLRNVNVEDVGEAGQVLDALRLVEALEDAGFRGGGLDGPVNLLDLRPRRLGSFVIDVDVGLVQPALFPQAVGVGPDAPGELLDELRAVLGFVLATQVGGRADDKGVHALGDQASQRGVVQGDLTPRTETVLQQKILIVPHGRVVQAVALRRPVVAVPGADHPSRHPSHRAQVRLFRQCEVPDRQRERQRRRPQRLGTMVIVPMYRPAGHCLGVFSVIHTGVRDSFSTVNLPAGISGSGYQPSPRSAK